MATYDPVITPAVFYADPLAAMRWLEKAFGFETVLLVQGPDGSVGYSEMAFNGAVISVGGEWAGDQLGGAKMRSPKNIAGAATQFLWIKVDDADAHCAAARAAGARITQEPEDQFYGARTYRARDLEGHVWCFTQPKGDAAGAEPVVKPAVFYNDPMAALRWLERAFGFETTALVRDGEGNPQYLESGHRGATMMICGEWAGEQIGGARMTAPTNLDGAATQFIWVKVEDAKAHCAAARAAGAQIAQEPEDQFYGARTYRVRDPEGHVWCFTQAVKEVPVEQQEKQTGLMFKNKLD